MTTEYSQSFKRGYNDYLFDRHLNPYNKMFEETKYMDWKVGYNEAKNIYGEVEKPFDFKQAII